MQYCTKCLNVSMRPRITFNEKGVCSACQWDEAKKTTVDWNTRWKELERLCDKYRVKDGSSNWDVIVPCSGGKDGSYVAWRMKHDMGMHPLCMTLVPVLQTAIGRQNLDNFKKIGFDHIGITANPKVYARLARKGFREQGRPMLPSNDGITTALLKFAIKLNIPFIVYGEEGESEYGGAMTQVEQREMDRASMINCYYSGHEQTEYLNEFTREELKWWLLPSEEEMVNTGIFITQWSKYENWDPYRHYLFSKEKCGFQTLPTRSIGTYTNFAQLDDDAQDLHAYLMFLKFGFGRTTSDVCIDIRRGALDRKQALSLVKKYDGEYPEELIPVYLEYFDMTQGEFDSVIDRFANKELLKKVNGRWVRNFEPR